MCQVIESKICARCGVRFRRPLNSEGYLLQPSHWARARYCSKRCSSRSAGEAAAARLDTRTSVKCEGCDVQMMQRPSRRAKGLERFHSRECFFAHRRSETIAARGRCLRCGEPTKENRSEFCSKACMATWKRAMRPWFVCPVCGDKFQRMAAWVRKIKSGAMFCSRACQTAKGGVTVAGIRLSAREVAWVMGVSLGRVHYWIRRGLIAGDMDVIPARVSRIGY